MLMVALFYTSNAVADNEPTINPTAIYTNSGTEDGDSTSAPATYMFKANVENLGAYTAHYEWKFYLLGNESKPYLNRYDEDTEYTFTEAGTHCIELYATFINGTDTIEYAKEYWSELGPIKITISVSKLEMPNAFSPNGDGINDIYKAKDGYKSLTEFHAYIFNRWGHKLYEWSDPAGGWDGKYNGKDVAQGVYFVLVKAKGADGIEYNIKRDVNLLRGYTQSSSSSSTSE